MSQRKKNLNKIWSIGSPRDVWVSFASVSLEALKCPLDELSGKFAKLYCLGHFEKWSKIEQNWKVQQTAATAAAAAKAMTTKQKFSATKCCPIDVKLYIVEMNQKKILKYYLHLGII